MGCNINVNGLGDPNFKAPDKTDGATFLGAANKLKDEYPHVNIRAFAAVRALSPPDSFSNKRKC
jgi:hypothetical protein